MRSGALCFLLGVCLLLQWHHLPSLGFVLGLLGCVLVACALRMCHALRDWIPDQARDDSVKEQCVDVVIPDQAWDDSAYKNRVILFITITAIGFVYAWGFSVYRLSHVYPRSLVNHPVLVQGVVVSIPNQQARYTKFNFYITHIVKQPLSFKGLVKLTVYDDHLSIKAGQRYQLLVKLKPPWGFANPGGFLYQQYLFMQGVQAVGYVKSSDKNHMLPFVGQWLLKVRGWLAKEILQFKSPESRFIVALSIGDRSGLTAADWQILQKTGTNHLVAISGLHVGLVSGLLFLLVSFLWRQSAFLCLRYPAPMAGAVAAMSIALIYSALAGFALPTQRALIMLVVFMSTYLLKRELLSFTAWCLALWIVLLVNPLNVLSVGFWLSFAAVGFLILGMKTTKPRGIYQKWLKPQWVVMLGVMPFTLYFFHQAAIVSPIANGLTIPLVGLFVVPCCLLGCGCLLLHIPIAAVFFYLASLGMQLAWWILTMLAQLSIANNTVAPLWAIALCVLGVGLLLSPLRIGLRLFGILGFVPLLLYKPTAPALGQFRLSLLDVGQGLASVVQTAHHVLVFDTGPKFSPQFNTGAAVVVPYLFSLGVSTVDMLVISHGDNDHIGGAQSVIQLLTVKDIKTSVPARFPNQQKITNLCLRGVHWRWDGVDFRFLYPVESLLGLDNNSSCVLRISNGHYSVLMTGDIEARVERYLFQHEKPTLSSTILIAPHHGSKTSSTIQFIKAVHPRYVLYPVGFLNRYHFPSVLVVKRYQSLGVRQLSTARCGMISFLAGETLSEPYCYRDHLGFYE